MDGNDEERRALIHEYYQIYRSLQKRHCLREHSYFDNYCVRDGCFCTYVRFGVDSGNRHIPLDRIKEYIVY